MPPNNAHVCQPLGLLASRKLPLGRCQLPHGRRRHGRALRRARASQAVMLCLLHFFLLPVCLLHACCWAGLGWAICHATKARHAKQRLQRAASQRWRRCHWCQHCRGGLPRCCAAAAAAGGADEARRGALGSARYRRRLPRGARRPGDACAACTACCSTLQLKTWCRQGRQATWCAQQRQQGGGCSLLLPQLVQGCQWGGCCRGKAAMGAPRQCH